MNLALLISLIYFGIGLWTLATVIMIRSDFFCPEDISINWKDRLPIYIVVILFWFFFVILLHLEEKSEKEYLISNPENQSHEE